MPLRIFVPVSTTCCIWVLWFCIKYSGKLTEPTYSMHQWRSTWLCGHFKCSLQAIAPIRGRTAVAATVHEAFHRFCNRRHSIRGPTDVCTEYVAKSILHRPILSPGRTCMRFHKSRPTPTAGQLILGFYFSHFQCMLWSWILSLETQFFVVACIILLILKNHPRYGIAIFGSFLIGSFFATTALRFHDHHQQQKLNSRWIDEPLLKSPLERFSALIRELKQPKMCTVVCSASGLPEVALAMLIPTMFAFVLHLTGMNSMSNWITTAANTPDSVQNVSGGQNRRRRRRHTVYQKEKTSATFCTQPPHWSRFCVERFRGDFVALPSSLYFRK